MDNLEEKIVTNPNPLFIAAYQGNLEGVIEALKTIPIDTPTNQITPLVAAISEGHEKVANYLISHGADVNKQTVMGTPLTIAIDNNKNSLVQSLLENGANCNQGNEHSKASPLLHAVCHRNTEAVKYLLDAHCDLYESQYRSNLALLNAIYYDVDEISKLLIQAKCDLNVIDNVHGVTALIQAILKKNVAITNLIIDSGADVNLSDVLGNSPLIYAASINAVATMDKLLLKGADVNHLNKAGTSCYGAAPFNSEAEKLILNHNPIKRDGLQSITKQFKRFLLVHSQNGLSPIPTDQMQLLFVVLSRGYCYGYALLRLLARRHKQNKPFTESLTRIANWDGQLSSLQQDKELSIIFNTLLTELMMYHQYTILPHQGKEIHAQYINNLVTDEIWEVNETHEFLYKRDELAKALQYIFAEEDQMIVFNHNHAIALAKSAKHGYVIYNLASDVMKVTATTFEALADKLLCTFDETNQISIGFEFIRLKNNNHDCHLDALNQYRDEIFKKRLNEHELYLSDSAFTVLDLAVVNQNVALFHKLLEALVPPPEKIRSALTIAVQINNVDFIQKLYELDVKSKSVVDYSQLLLNAATLNNQEALLYLLKVNAQLPDTCTASLYDFAIKNNNLATVKALYHLGYNLFTANKIGMTPLQYAKRLHHAEIEAYIYKKQIKHNQNTTFFQPSVSQSQGIWDASLTP